QGGLGGFFSSIGGAFKKFFGGGGGGGGGFGLPDLSGIGVQAGTQAGTGFLSTMGSFLGKAANWLPVVGPIIGAFAGPLMNGLKKVWGGIKSLFGGPGEGELAARATVDQINDSLKAIIPTQELISAGSEEWQKNNVAQVNIIMALGGKISDMEGIWARFANASKDPASAAAFAEFWQEKLAAVQAKMAETGMTLEELRKAATKSAKDGSEAHEKSAKKIKDAYGVAQEAIRDDDTLTADQRKLKLDALQQQYAETMEAVKAKTREAKGEISNLGETVELSFSTDVDKIRDDIQRGIGESNPVEVALASEDFFERFARGVRGGLEDAFEDMGI
ncbi:MAG: hypothetical protein OES26_25675, partial [Gammaproteobacteria bacterium]|nr:hypothetical protein [Gammaproteobacteria bacterium]